MSLTRFEGEVQQGHIHRTGYLYCFSDVGDVCIAQSKSRKDYAALEMFHQLEREWLSVFRRGCWISGYDNEATAHEKAEWMRGFTEEEIEKLLRTRV